MTQNETFPPRHTHDLFYIITRHILGVNSSYTQVYFETLPQESLHDCLPLFISGFILMDARMLKQAHSLGGASGIQTVEGSLFAVVLNVYK